MAVTQKPPTSKQTHVVSLIVVVVAAIFAVAQFVHIANHPEKYQWDFRTYHTAAQADALGENFFDIEVMRKHSTVEAVSMYLYPPLTIWIFRPFASMPYETAAIIWLVIKAVFALALILIWRRWFMPEWNTAMAAIVIAFGFGATFYVDLVTGNITVIEQFFLWLGLACLLAKRDWMFVGLIVLASAFKFTPTLFLLTAFLIGRPRKWRMLLVGTGAVLVWLGLNYWVDPAQFSQYWASAWSLQESAAQGNPSHLRFWWDLLAVVTNTNSARIPAAIPLILFGVSVIGILWLSHRARRSVKLTQDHATQLALIFLFCTVYALMMPRFKSYAYILVLPAAYHVLTRARQLPGAILLLALFLSSSFMPLPNPVPLGSYLVIFWLFYPLLLTFLVWALLIGMLKQNHLTPARN